MQIYDYDAYKWNRCVAPHGNMGKVNPQQVANLCDMYGIPWYTTAWPYSSGIKAYCEDDALWNELIKQSKES